MGTKVKMVIGAAALALSLGVAGAAMAWQEGAHPTGVQTLSGGHANEEAITQTATHSCGNSGSPGGCQM